MKKKCMSIFYVMNLQLHSSLILKTSNNEDTSLTYP